LGWVPFARTAGSWGIMRSRPRSVRARRSVLAAFAITSLVAAACGGDDDSSEDTTAPAPSAETAAPTTAGGDAAETSVPAASGDAQAQLAELLTRPTKITQTEPVTGDLPTDKSVIWIQCSVPACIALGQPFQEAMDALGWDLKIITHDGTPEGVKDAYAEAVRDEPDAVVSSGYPRQMFDPEIAELAAKDIPVIQLTVTDPPGDGIVQVVNGPARNAEIGRELAVFVAADSGGSGKALWATSTFPILVPELEGIEGRPGFAGTLEELCPDCSYESLEVPIDALATQAPQRIVSYLQANPDVTYVVGAFADIVTALPGALADAGLDDKVKIVVYSQNETISAALESGDIEAVIGFAGPEDMWQIADTLVRHFMDLPYEAEWDELPTWIITAETVPSTTEYYPLVADYQEQYKALWGLG
jgi:ribose transport system substrate-binding protein